jgi:hypothetical protein
MFINVGIANSAGVATALIVGCSVLPTLWLQWRGGKRQRRVDSSDV